MLTTQMSCQLPPMSEVGVLETLRATADLLERFFEAVEREEDTTDIHVQLKYVVLGVDREGFIAAMINERSPAFMTMCEAHANNWKKITGGA